MQEENRFTFPALLKVVFWPVSLSYVLLAYVFAYISGRQQRHIVGRATSYTREDDPKVCASRFASRFDDDYGTDHVPFFQGAYMEALAKAKADLKFLLVYLHSEEHDQADTFCREVLCHPQFHEFTRSHDVLFWAGDIRDEEASKVAGVYQVSAYPFLALVVQKPRQGGGGSSQMSAVHVQEGLAPVDEVVQGFSQRLSRFETALQALRAERREREMAREIREQQDAAYQASLAADREKKRIAEKAAQKKEQQALVAAYSNVYRRRRLQELPEEPKAGDEEPTVRLSFRTATGGRLVRRFRGSDTLEDVYTFIDTYGMEEENPASSSPSSADTELPDDYVHEYEFTLASLMPRKVFPCEGANGHSVLSDIRELWPSANLVVESKDLEEEEEC
ncbi:thioredoxin-like protein [Piptocephalis cylindrospora]|uniref:Thioredoxin-like protein n=1 Tax=Piptocephalis cylindrospora TaxID=1907219 RepID=A0A4P9Y3X0_9FUNG|nr:thioredoxin-like protein [Piptocephalis cylindrospora]|eukprot:RKP13523.1 thioredoxin-like protein [Piptocephalis cylindrospora]